VLVDRGFDFGLESALSESSSKSACAFPVISSARRVRASSALEPLVAAPQLLHLDLLGRAPCLLPGRQALAGARLPGLAPLGDVRGVQALAPEQGATLLGAHGQGVVLGEDPLLVLGSEGSPPRPGGRDMLVHRAIMGAREQGCSGHGHRSTWSRLAL